MNPFMQAVVTAVLSSKRKCPSCGRTQAVPQGKAKETVKCKYCGADVPPHK